ncbi:hypothetical protein T281_06635 [Rhodomicrobium udaipurense JA643]|uniref:Uncharacterized protein n=1 Tax=Rhodomicrobium udaipurense TaxID=1202716 RepID=A0A8I1GCT5_9HYPH|nr:hypothetical protein [Rhodomicrobium udaipurense]KAI95225.1 hypothetical protein T281_06635 [Rhodomicrobium udaipurense JA643]MBJ7542534.1 hypothetical protein [Rhodomicrobium udaipurense]
MRAERDDGLADALREPDLIREYVLAYRAERERLAADEAKARKDVEKRLAAAKRSFDRIVDAIADGSVTTATVRDKLAILQAEMDRHQADFAAIPAPLNVVDLHPAALQRYISHLEKLATGLAGENVEAEREVMRELIDRVIVYLSPKGKIDVEVRGKITSLTGDEHYPPPAKRRVFNVGAGGPERSSTPTDVHARPPRIAGCPPISDSQAAPARSGTGIPSQSL